ncbi:MAG: hypothetical protein Q7R40_16555 [Phaeospirillum sp.]|nr:hypothetical protein [Phaeospirillum sp.]
MRSTWPFIAGVIIAGLVTAFTLPILIATGLVMMAAGSYGHDDAVLRGGSSFALRDDHGRYTSRLINTTYTILGVPMVGEPRPRRLLLRQHIVVGEDGEGQARLDAWLMGSPAELRKAPLYTIWARAASAALGDDSMFWTERAGRRTAYSLADGNRLFDADLPIAQFIFEPEARRMAALAVADEEFSGRGGVAVITYAAPGRVLRRVVLVADDLMRANMIRATLSSTKLLSFIDEPLGGRMIELPLGAGIVRVPVGLNDLDLARAVVPAGLRLVPIRPWGNS